MYLEKIKAYTNVLFDVFEGKDLLALINEKIAQEKNKSIWIPYKYEKDFWLTVILDILSKKFSELAFKGGTCLNKIYFPMFRMSEDLDFVYNNIYNYNTNSRDVRSDILNDCFSRLQSFMPDLGFVFANKVDENGKQRFKHNVSKNGIFIYEYKSVIDGSIQTIKIDIIVGPEILKPLETGIVTSIFPCFGNITIPCYNLVEMLAEKMKAALTRTEPAIRDYYDIWYAFTVKDFDFTTEEYLFLLKQKLKDDNYAYTFNEPGAYENLDSQIEYELYPVLLDWKDTNFSLLDAYNIVSQFYLAPDDND